jgi:hypothetical protein
MAVCNENERTASPDRSSSSGPRRAVEMDRREFGKKAAAGLAGLAGLAAWSGAPNAAAAAAAPAGPTLPGLVRKKVGELYRRPLGATGLWVSELTLGGSPSAPPNVFAAAVEKGVNYCDTSPRYTRGKGEEDLGRILKGRRDKMYVGTKITPTRDGVNNKADILKQIDGSLKRLGMDYVDILCIHGGTTDAECFADWVFEAMDQIKKDGKARFFGVSVHNTAPEFNRRLIECGHYQVLMIPLNMYFETPKPGATAAGVKDLQSMLRLAVSKGVGILTMKTLAAGGLANVKPPEGVSPAQAKLRWVLRRPEITGVLNEMNTFEYLKEDVAASAADLKPAEEAWLRENTLHGAQAFCRMCRSCEARCAARLPIPDLLRARMYAVDYGDRARALELAGELGARACLDRCEQCGRCEEGCPWGVHTRSMLDDLRHRIG